MKPNFPAVLMMALGLLPAVVNAQARTARPAGEDPRAPDAIKVERIRDNLYLLKGGGGNTTVFVASTGVVVVDTKNPGWGAPLLAKIRTLTDRPITTIINTHTHGDHVSGNVEFPADVDVVTQENTRQLMAEMKPTVNDDERGSAPEQVFRKNDNRNLPKHTYKDRMTIGNGADRVELYHFGPGHTGGDTFVVFPAARVMAMGDVFSNTNLPNVDTNNGGSAIGITQVLARAAKIPGVDTVIPGHGDAALPFADLQQYAEFNHDFMTWAEREMKAGKSVEQAAAEYQVPARYQGYGAQQPARIKRVVQQFYDEFRRTSGAK